MHSSQDFSQFRILIVDDVPLNRVLVEKMLGNFNFKVRQCENGLECMKEFYYQKPDLVLLDILMPLMDGFEVIEAVRENPQWKNVKIVVLSALNSNEDIVKAFNLGANDFITKPIVMDKLLNTVAKHLGLPIDSVSK
jgi:CheY-like chemotaxis protein